MSARGALGLLAGVAILAPGGGLRWARAEKVTTAAAPAGGLGVLTPSAFEAGLRDDLDIVVLPPGRRPPPRPTVIAATRVHATPDAIGAVLLAPAAYREALPSLVAADVVATRPGAGARPSDGPDRLLAWELEIPLFNLKGKAWLARRGDTIELQLVEGAFAPGLLRFRVAATPDGRASTLTCALQIEARSANWIFRRIARHDPGAETAMAAATAWVVARAVALRAEAPTGSAPARPRDPITPPPVSALDGSPLATAAFAPLGAGHTIATVKRAPSGRLAWASVAVAVPGTPATVAVRLATPETWGAYPGWKSVKRLPERKPPAPPPPGAPPTALVAVTDDVAFVDLDATWRATPAPPARATAVDGDTRGAVFAWDTYPDPRPPGTALAVLSMHPRLDASGFVARKMVAAEPLLEHALALALTYADAAAVAASLGGH